MTMASLSYVVVLVKATLLASLRDCCTQRLHAHHHCSHMCCRTDDPKPTARKVAIAYPNVPTNSDGTIELFQPFAAAIPAAVVGPARQQHDDGYTSAFTPFSNMTSKNSQPMALTAKELAARACKIIPGKQSI
jgi:hypothetical protein